MLRYIDNDEVEIATFCLIHETQRKWLKAALISTYPDAQEYIIKLGDYFVTYI